MASVRTTVMAEQELMLRLRLIADDEGLSLAEVIRQGLEWRAEQGRRRLSFTGAGVARPGLAPVDWSAPLSDDPAREAAPGSDEVQRLRALAARRARELSDRAAG